MTIDKINSTIHPLEQIDKINEIIDELYSSSRSIGEIVTSILPLTEAGLHLLDGTLLSGDGSYSAFVSYIADLYNSNNYPNLFTIETLWQNSIASYGECGKFVYTEGTTYYAWTTEDEVEYQQIYTAERYPTTNDKCYHTIQDLINDTNGITIEQATQSHIVTDITSSRYYYDSDKSVTEPATVRLPKIEGILQSDSTISELGDLIEAGLPTHNHTASTDKTGAHTHAKGTFEITGSISFKNDFGKYQGLGTATGAFSGSSSATITRPDGGDDVGTTKYNRIANFKASDNWSGATASNGAHTHTVTVDNINNSIYGNSLTVQPQAIKVLCYIVVANSTKTEIEVDIDEIATEVNNKADRDGSNMISSVKKIDGQWIKSSLSIATNVAIGTTNYVYDLSSYLPNDGYNYEVLFGGNCTTGTTSGNSVALQIITDVLNANWIAICGARTRVANANFFGSGNAIVPVGTGRTVIVCGNSSWAGTFSMAALAYRRIGTNS